MLRHFSFSLAHCSHFRGTIIIDPKFPRCIVVFFDQWIWTNYHICCKSFNIHRSSIHVCIQYWTLEPKFDLLPRPKQLFALVIGIGKYAFKQFSDLPSTVPDAKEIKGVVEHGKETNTHFFFSESCLTPSPLYLLNRVCFFHRYVFGDFFSL